MVEMVTGTCTTFLREDLDLGRFVLIWVPVTYTTSFLKGACHLYHRPYHFQPWFSGAF